MRGLVIFSAIFCLMVAALISYISGDNTYLAIFTGFDFVYLLGVVAISKITYVPDKNKEFDAYRSAHSL